MAVIEVGKPLRSWSWLRSPRVMATRWKRDGPGVAFKLILGLALTSGLTIITAAAAAYFTSSFQLQFEDVSNVQIPRIIAATRVSQQSESIIAEAPSLALATSNLDLDAAYRRAKDQTSWLDEIIDDLAVSSIEVDQLRRLRGLKEKIEANLARIHQLVTDRLNMEAKQQASIRDAQLLSEKLSELKRKVAEAGWDKDEARETLRWADETLHRLLLLVSAAQTASKTQVSQSTVQWNDDIARDLDRFAEHLQIDCRSDSVAKLLVSANEIHPIHQALVQQERTIEAALEGNRLVSQELISSAWRIVDDVSRSMVEVNRRFGDESSRRTQLTVSLVLLCTLSLIGSTFYVRKSVIRRLHALRHRIQEGLGKGPWLADHDAIEADTDEIGEIARAFQRFRQIIVFRNLEVKHQHAQLKSAMMAAEKAAAEEAALRRSVTEAKEEAALSNERAQSILMQSQKMNAIGQLSGGLAHDFNNILAVVISSLQLIEKLGIGSDATPQLMHTALDAVQRGKQLTSALLSFARTDAMGETKDTNINIVVNECHDVIERALTPAIKLAYNLEQDLRLVRLNKNELENVLLNLAINARDAMPQGGRLTISTTNQVSPAGEKTVLLSISDSGTGIPPEIIDRIFEPFFTTKEVGKGTGLGLAMVYGFVKRHGGTIQVKSEHGVGTTFELSLPAALSASADHEHKPEVVWDLQQLPRGDGVTLLAVDDEPDILENTRMFLTSLGYDVLTARNGEDALDVLQSRPQTAILVTDWVMPGRYGGGELIVEARKVMPDLKVLVVSGFMTIERRGGTRAFYDGEIISKPYSLADLAHRLATIRRGE